MKRIILSSAVGLALLAPTGLPAEAMTVPANVGSEATTLVPAESVAHKQAVRMAKRYLSMMPFSRSGLIKQLRYEGFSKSVATNAVDSLGVSWKKQSARMAKRYLDMMPFSRSGLIKQLRYEGFSDTQARYGVTAAGL